MLKVIKRDGRIKEFDFDRIENAVVKAYMEVYSTDEEISDVVTELDSVVVELQSIFDKMVFDETELVTVEDIQDIIVSCVTRYNAFVAASYSEYRAVRTNIRDKKSKLMTEIYGLLDHTNLDVMLENSNKQATLASTQRDLIAGEVSKSIARNVIPEYIINAHDSGLIKIHDLDYYAQDITNCELVDLGDMLQNGTVINKKKINKPRSLRTAMTLATQIAAQVASSTYGGQTMSLSHLAPFVRVSEEKLYKKYRLRYPAHPNNQICEWVEEDLKEEIKDAVQTFNYQISTIMTTNGQAPFISVCMYISEDTEYEKETVMLIEEFLKQRIEGMENEFGIKTTQTFPKLLYFLDDNNTKVGDPYYWLTQLAIKSTSLRMNPDFISVKKMKEVIGFAFPTMGCRAMLSPFKDKDGKWIFYGRGNLGAQTINLPYVALMSSGNIDLFWKELDHALNITRDMCALRYEKLRGVKASVAPILWQHGALARLNQNDDILKAIDDKGFTVSIGYAGIYETVKYLTGESHTSVRGFELAKDILSYLQSKCLEFKQETPHLRFALYGTPQESTTGWFSDKIKSKFGIVKDVTDKGWITNSYHIDIRENIDAFEKLRLEGILQSYSTGGAVSYIETCNMNKNIEALEYIVYYMYNHIMYSEINFESDKCGVCGYDGVMDNDQVTSKWVCPQCGNNDQAKLSVVRRTCGYLGENDWSKGRLADILNRVKHL